MVYRTLVQAHKIYERFRNFGHMPDKDWASQLVEWQISPSSIDFEPQSGKIFFKPLEISLAKGKHDFILNPKTLTQVKNLKKIAKTKFYIDTNDELNLEIDGTRLIVENEQDLAIVYEIFLQGAYNFVYSKPVVVLDIGMNIGFASLYFAARENVVAVFGYEPFEMTYQQALRNFSLNPHFSEKIKPFDYGVGGREEKILVEYDYNLKGSIGVGGIDNKYTPSQGLAKAELSIKPISDVFSGITAQYPSVDIVAKIDCEGSEYAILDALSANGQLSQIKIIMMEWHKKGPAPLVHHLQEAGFAIFSRLPRSKNVGMLYAVRG